MINLINLHEPYKYTVIHISYYNRTSHTNGLRRKSIHRPLYIYFTQMLNVVVLQIVLNSKQYMRNRTKYISLVDFSIIFLNTISQ